MKVSAPGIIKLLGEHAVVYGKTAVAAAISIYARAETREIPKRVLRIEIPQLNQEQDFTEADLRKQYGLYSKRKSINDFVENSTINAFLLPFATIASRLLVERHVDVLGKEVTGSSDIQPRAGLASSAAGYAAFLGSVLKACGKRLGDNEVIDIARDGDRISHISENAGAIDVATSYYGGYVECCPRKYAKKVDSRLDTEVVIIDTGPKKSTAEMVGRVRKLYESDRQATEKIFDAMQNCTEKGIEALRKSDLKGIGRLMYENHLLLRKLGVSTEGLDRAVKISMDSDAYGAKLSGGGGGGTAIAFTKDPGELVDTLQAHGFRAYKTNISDTGVKSQLI